MGRTAGVFPKFLRVMGGGHGKTHTGIRNLLGHCVLCAEIKAVLRAGLLLFVPCLNCRIGFRAAEVAVDSAKRVDVAHLRDLHQPANGFQAGKDRIGLEDHHQVTEFQRVIEDRVDPFAQNADTEFTRLSVCQRGAFVQVLQCGPELRSPVLCGRAEMDAGNAHEA